jgi:hypothetical protein
MEHLAQKEDIQMRPNSVHLLALLEDRNDEVEVLDQGMTSYQSTEDMCETISLLHYSALTGTIEDDMWIIDSGASRHMTGDRARLSNLNEKKTSYKVELGDKTTYPVEGFGQAAIKMKTGNYVHLSNVLYVPGLEKNLVSISCLEDKGNRIAFVDGKVLSWHKDSSIENVRVIGSREGNLYRLLEQNEKALVHDEVNPNELWHRRYAHINYQALPELLFSEEYQETRLGFSKSHADPNLYYKVVDNAPMILLLYVDDLFITGEESLIIQGKKELASEFDMKDLGLMHYYLGLEVWQKRGEVFLGQGKYAIKILQKFGMMDCKSMDTPMNADMRKVKVPDSDPVDPSLYRQLIGSLMYLVNTRPDICFVVNTLSQFQVEPRHEHWIAAKHVLRYIRGTINYGLRYTASSNIQLHGFTDSDWAGSAEDRKSTSGMCFSLGSAMISWGNRKQKSVALSTTEAEYMAACEACTEAIWLRKLISDLFDQIPESTIIYCDNQSSIRLSEQPVFHERSKHIEIKYYFI